MRSSVFCLLSSVLFASCLANPTEAETPLTRGEFAEALCFHLYDCVDVPTSIAGGADKPLDISNPVACIRTVRAGWRWIDENTNLRTLGDDLPGCAESLAALTCPLSSRTPEDDTLGEMLDACSL